jgi:Na+-driven multidrug efflux pump
VALVWGVNQTFLVLMWGIQPTLLALMARGENPASGRRFAYVVAMVVAVPSAVVAFVPPLTSLVVHTLLGATGRLQDMTETGLRVLAALPPLLVQEAIYTSAILSTRKTRLIVYVNILRLVGLLAILGATVSFTDWPGGVIGVVAMGGSLVVEAITTMLYGYQSQEQLEARWAARVSASQAST